MNSYTRTRSPPFLALLGAMIPTGISVSNILIIALLIYIAVRVGRYEQDHERHRAVEKKDAE